MKKTKAFYFSLAFIFSFLLLTITAKNEYALENLEFSPFSNSFTGDLIYKSESLNITDYNIPQIRNNNIDLIKNLNLSVVLECNEILHIKITDKENERFEPPFIIDSNYKENVKKCRNEKSSKIKSLENFGFSLSDNYNTTFAFSLKNPKTNETYLLFENNNFFYSETLIVFESFLTSNNIYGLGERNHKFKLNDGLYTIWPNDTGNAQDMESGGFNLYGSQPFALHRTAKGLFVGLFYNNINAQDFKIQTLNTNQANLKDQNSKVSLEQRTIGGIIDLYIFIGESPEEVISKYQSIIGFATLPPYWALGWQQSRWGIRNDTYLKSIVDKYESNQLPLDVVWADIDYMDEYRDFTVDKSRYGGLPNLVNYLHKRDKYFVPILDIGIPFNKNDKFFQLGSQMDIFLKSNYTKNYLQHIVWPGVCVFPDWFHPNSTAFWHAGLENLYSQIQFDGIWQDMNEPAALWDNASGRGEINSSLDPDFNEYENIPYVPGNGNIDLISHSISVNAYNYFNKTADSNANSEKLLRTFNTKPLNSLMQSQNTYSFLAREGKRPFILSRSNVAGLSKISNHWLGDNTSTWASMRDSISGIFAHQMFGFALVGADICGFNGETTDALCARWTVLGSFYPFSRNHNTLDAKPQEPFNAGPNTLKAANIAIKLRYSLIRYIYSKLFLMSIRGGTMFKPAFFEFADDESLLNADNIENNIMVGDAFLLTPSFDAEENSFDGYLPNAHWNDFQTGKSLRSYNKESKQGDKFSFSGKFEDVNLFMRGGKIVPKQQTENVQNTNSLRKVSTQLIINPDSNFNASGEIIFDDGYRLDTRETKDYLHIKISLYYDSILFNIKNNFVNKKNYDYEDIKLSKVILYRADYLQKTDYVQVKLRNGEYDYVNFDAVSQEDKENNRISFDLTSLNLRFDDIESLIIVNNGSFQEAQKQLSFIE